ncbi:MAG: glycoside hydrolase family 127 protein, partial [Saprospiraceae bacterium]|nr:glycoside hydrolase family 127 protein [Saprospiraceae bacterium]
RLDYMLDPLALCQEKNSNGYVGGIPDGKQIWQEIAAGNIAASNFSLNGRWVPLYNIHKLLAGLRDAYLIAGQEKALEILLPLTDWFMEIVSGLSEVQIQEMLRSEHGGLNEVFADMAAITGAEKYLELAKIMSHNAILHPLLQGEDRLTGLHANTQIPKVVGYQRIAQLGDLPAWNEASEFFWQTIVDQRSVSIGGNSVREHFHPVDDFSSMIESNQGPETCNTYNMLRLTKLLFLSNPKAEYIDYYERALYNHILSSQHPDGGFVYFTPMRPRHYRVYSQPHHAFWCCVGSGLENHGKYGEMIYAHDDENLFVNLFLPSRLHWKEKGLVLEQSTQFPYEESASLNIQLDKPERFGLHLRYPGWVQDGALTIMVNGKKRQIDATPSSYVVLNRKWKNGDRVDITLPMQTTLEYLPDSSSWASFLHGPIVLAAKTSSDNLKGLRADDSRMGHVADGQFYPIEEAPLIVTQSGEMAGAINPIPQQPLTFSASRLIYPDRFDDLELVPFFSIHDARYMLYWQVTSQENLENVKEALRERERELITLEARTVDQVALGEQQPESEHDFAGEDTEIGSTTGESWRSATGWFSYRLDNPQGEGRILRFTYARGGQNRRFDILLNGQLLQTVELDDSWEEGSFYIDYEIPAVLLANLSGDSFELKIRAREGASTGRVYHVRLLQEE